jgi:EmrB/QacA subfamily drug resistance transporter
MGAFMIQVDASIVTLTFHALQVAFDAPLGAVQWVSLSYVLAMVALVTPIGRFSDVLGRKRVYLIGFSVFTVGSALCGVAPSLAMLIVFRLLQAVGAAAIASNSVAVVTTSMPRDKLRAGLAVQSSVQALGLASGPVIGGFLVDLFGWRSVFYVNVPIGIAAVIVGVAFLPRTKSVDKEPHLDRVGTALLATTTTGLMLGLSGVSGLDMPTALLAVFMGLTAVAAPALWWWERRARYPLLDAQLLRSPQISIGLLGAHFSYLLLYAPLVLIPQLLIPRGYGENTVGPVLSALPLGFVLASLADTVLVKGHGNRTRLLVGAGLATLALLPMLVHPAELAWLVPLLFALGLGLGIFIPANNAVVMSGVPRSLAGLGSGLLSMLRNLGTALGVAFVTLALHLAGHDSRLPAADHTGPAYMHLMSGGRYALLVLIAAAGVTMLIAVALCLVAGSAGAVTGVVLAAGAGSRFGMPKVLGGKGDWLKSAVAALSDGGCGEVIVVVGAAVVDVAPPAQAVVAKDWADGLSASLRAGVSAAESTSAEYLALMPVDTPDVGAEVVHRVIVAARASGLARASYSGRPGHPVVVARRFWGELVSSAVGDSGGRAFLNGRTDVVAVDCADLASGRDIDTH